MKISDIKIPKRIRKAMGDIEALAASMDDVGLLQHVAVDDSGTFLVG